ncbi:hypothetical protein [Rhodococcus opacus]|uniref:hypothetical protein n=1 Tax=Rhodococcus opacus TaxID=37919 RepID=UPI002476F9CB|nr:hypothetical protein [Rhodococcus opacus]
MPPRTALETAIANDVLAAAQNGTGRPADIAKRLAEYDMQARSAAEDRALVDRALHNARHLAAEAKRNGIPAAYEVVRTELSVIVGLVEENADALRTATTAEDALRSGAHDAWLLVDGLVTRYEGMRNAHWDVARFDSQDGSRSLSYEVFYASALLANHLDVDPYWRGRRSAAAASISGSARGDLAQHRAWLTSTEHRLGQIDDRGHSALWPQGVSQQRWLLHIVEHGQPWVLDAAGIEQVHRLATSATQPLAQSDQYALRAAMSARDKHAEIVSA